MMLEHRRLSLNPRGTLYRNKLLIKITVRSENTAASEAFEQAFSQAEWVVYKVRRIYQAAKDAAGNPNPEKKRRVSRRRADHGDLFFRPLQRSVCFRVEFDMKS